MTSCTKAILHVLVEIFFPPCSQKQERQLSRRIFAQLLAGDCFINMFLIWYWPALKVKVRWNHTSLKNHIRSEWFKSFLRLEGGMFSTNTSISIVSLDLSQALGRADCTAFKIFKSDFRTVGVDSVYSIWETTTWFECNGLCNCFGFIGGSLGRRFDWTRTKKKMFSQLRPNSWLVWKPTHGVHIKSAAAHQWLRCSFVKKRVIFSGMDTEWYGTTSSEGNKLIPRFQTQSVWRKKSFHYKFRYFDVVYACCLFLCGRPPGHSQKGLGSIGCCFANFFA